MLQASAGLVPALNDNFSTSYVAEGLTASLAALRCFNVPDIPRRTAAAGAFASFRLALLSWQVTSDHHCRGGERRSRQSVQETSRRLAEAPCTGAIDLAMKALAFHSLAHSGAAGAVLGRDHNQIIADVLGLADFAAALASDALAIAGSASL